MLIFLNIEKELSSTVPWHGKTRSDDMFQSLYANLLEMKVPIHNLASMSTDDTPIMTIDNGLILLRKKFPLSQIFIVTNVSFISKMCEKIIDFQHLIVVQNVENSIRPTPVQHRSSSFY
jgi:hypothetical protein